MLNNQVDKDTFYQLQQNDHSIAQITKQLSYPENKLSKLYVLQDNILYKRSSTYPKIYMPYNIMRNLVRFIHDTKAHISESKLIEYFELHYYSPKIRKFSKMAIQECFLCQSLNIPPESHKRTGTQRFFQPRMPRAGWSFDILLNFLI